MNFCIIAQIYNQKTMKKVMLLSAVLVLFLNSCSSVQRTMREPNVRVELEREDFELSAQVSAEATSTRIIGIDFQRLFSKTSGSVEGGAALINVASLPVIGNILMDPTANYALYQLMANNPGYDVIFYPQYETTMERPFIGLGFIYRKTTVKTTARLGKLK